MPVFCQVEMFEKPTSQVHSFCVLPVCQSAHAEFPSLSRCLFKTETHKSTRAKCQRPELDGGDTPGRKKGKREKGRNWRWRLGNREIGGNTRQERGRKGHTRTLPRYFKYLWNPHVWLLFPSTPSFTIFNLFSFQDLCARFLSVISILNKAFKYEA